jgi:hypothetical protein
MIAHLVELVRERLGSATHERAVAAGRAMDRAEAMARLDPATVLTGVPAAPAGQARRR